MKGELLIKSSTSDAFVDAWEIYGVNMGEGFLNAIDYVPSLKDFVESRSRLEHGKRVVVASPRMDSSEVTLTFTVSGYNKGTNPQAVFLENKRLFLMLLLGGGVDIKIPSLNNCTYHLIYKGKNATYALNRARTFCKIGAKFEEPNPNFRS